MNKNIRYSELGNKKNNGVFYTPKELSLFVSEKILEKINSQKGQIIIADPAIGDGELIISLLDHLQDRDVIIFGFDVDRLSIETCKKRILDKRPNVILHLIHGSFLEYSSQDSKFPKFDIIIANPPYVRAQILGSDKSSQLSIKYGLKGKVDLYQAFVVSVGEMLADDGVAGIILPNKFLTTKGAGSFREIIFDLYTIYDIWDFGDTKLFEAAVLPSVITFSLKNRRINKESVGFISIYETNKISRVDNVAVSPIDAIRYSGIVKTINNKYLLVKKGELEFDGNPKNVWRIKDSESENWLNNVKKFTWKTFGEIGKIRVGVKTTADNIFIRDSWDNENEIESDLIKPLLTHHVSGQFLSNSQSTKKILYTHTLYNGKKIAIDIDAYPKAKLYLERYKDQLEGRSYIKKSNRNWYEIWVPQKPELWDKEKIVFRDICEKPNFWMDKNGSVVNGDCYWMVNDYYQENEDILWLIMSIANSEFIEKFYDFKFNNKLYSNKRRFISQYVEKFPIPDPSRRISKEMINIAKAIYYSESKDINKLKIDLNNLVWEAFNLPKPDAN